MTFAALRALLGARDAETDEFGSKHAKGGVISAYTQPNAVPGPPCQPNPWFAALSHAPARLSEYIYSDRGADSHPAPVQPPAIEVESASTPKDCPKEGE